MLKLALPQLAVAMIWLSLSTPSHAYLDPGTGSIILQGVIAAIATASFAAKMYWQRIKSHFKGEQPSTPEHTEDPEQQEPRD